MAGKSPLELLTPDPERQPPFLNTIFNPLLGSIIGFSGVLFANWATRRPIMSGIQKHIFFTALGGVAGKYLDDLRNSRLAERDAVFRHYIELHPEDFPPPVRQKIGDIFEPWSPIR